MIRVVDITSNLLCGRRYSVVAACAVQLDYDVVDITPTVCPTALLMLHYAFFSSRHLRDGQPMSLLLSGNDWHGVGVVQIIQFHLMGWKLRRRLKSQTSIGDTFTSRDTNATDQSRGVKDDRYETFQVLK